MSMPTRRRGLWQREDCEISFIKDYLTCDTVAEKQEGTFDYGLKRIIFLDSNALIDGRDILREDV